MADKCTRKACTDDLKNYFKISDLLGGLSSVLQEQLRKNIGIEVGDAGLTAPAEITYSELLNKVNSNLLVVGTRYIITDYLTIYELDGVSYSADPKPLLVTVINTGMLDRRAVLVNSPELIVDYDITLETLTDGTKTKGTILFMKDSLNNSAHYDFKDVLFKRDGKFYYTFSYIREDGTILDASKITDTHDNKLGENCWNNVFIGDTYYNIFEADCKGNTFYSGCHDCFFKWETLNNTFNEQVVDLTGSIANKTFKAGDNTLSTAITKSIHNVNEATIVSFLDPITYAYQIIIV